MSMETALPAAVCFAVAGWMAVKGASGWGWFLFVGLLVAGAK